jgi:hypothetical protein
MSGAAVVLLSCKACGTVTSISYCAEDDGRVSIEERILTAKEAYDQGWKKGFRAGKDGRMSG